MTCPPGHLFAAACDGDVVTVNTASDAMSAATTPRMSAIFLFSHSPLMLEATLCFEVGVQRAVLIQAGRCHPSTAVFELLSNARLVTS